MQMLQDSKGFDKACVVNFITALCCKNTDFRKGLKCENIFCKMNLPTTMFVYHSFESLARRVKKLLV